MNSFRNQELFNVWYEVADKNLKTLTLQNYVVNKLPVPISTTEEEKVNTKLRLFCNNLTNRWKKCRGSLSYFTTKYADWLQSETVFEVLQVDINKGPKALRGRPSLSYNEKSLRSKRREAANLSHTQQHETTLIVQAASIAARNKRQTDLAVVLNEVNKTPTRPSKVRKILFSPKKEPIPFTPEEALAFLLDNNLSKQQYLNIRLANKMRNCNIYPAYEKILLSKFSCRIEEMSINDRIAKVPLSKLLYHTTTRIVQLQKEAILNKMEASNITFLNAEIIFSYGFDGSSGQANYKQKFDIPSTSANLDSTLFATTVIPLRLISADKTILWNNETPQSIRFCRPLKLEYTKETKENILKEKNDIDEEIKNLTNIEIEMANNKILRITYKLYMTLIDGKVLNILTGTKSSQCCPVCGASPRQFIKIEDFSCSEYEPKPNTLRFGASPLHSWIRFFECILHISYRCEIKMWQVKGEEKKIQVQKRKREIQKRFWENMSLHVDKPKANGSGNTNDGNTARRAFSQPELFSKITDVDETVIQRFRIILICLSCKYPLHLEKFQIYCFNTAKLYMEIYPWYPMPATVHKILIHAKEILANAVLPVGYFGEEASEARNKLYRRDREFHARKCSRSSNLEDVFCRAMDTSDPLISTISLRTRMNRRNNKLNLPSEALSLLSSGDTEPEPSTSSLTELEAESAENSDNDSEGENDLTYSLELENLDDLELDSE